MKKVFVKTISVGVSALFLSSIALTGCGNSADTPSASSQASTKPATSAAPAGPLTISWMVPQLTEENSYGQKYLEEKFNIKIKPYMIAAADYAQKQQVTLGGGDIPDVMMVLDPVSLQKYASQGLLAEVPVDTIAKTMPKYKAALDKDAPQAWFYSLFSGKNYGVTTFYPSGRFNAKAEWRTDLLKKAGIDKIPATIDEMTVAFEALKKIGVYGISSGAPGNQWFGLFKQIFPAYGVTPPQWMLKDGKVVSGAVQPEVKAALTTLADWYKKGYVDPDFVTGKDYKEKFIAGKLAYYDYGGALDTDESNASSMISLAKKTNPEAKVEIAPLPKGPGGQGDWAWGAAGNIIAFGKQLEKQPEKMKKIMEILEVVNMSDQGFTDLGLGKQGTDWDFKDAAKKQEGGIKLLAPNDNLDKRYGMGLGDGASFNPFTRQFAAEITDKWNPVVVEKSQQFNMPKVDLFGKPDVMPSSSKYWADLLKLKNETFISIVSGAKPVSAFDDFVKQWNTQGGEQLAKEANEMYAQVKK
ncbi:extracellular solute-binding protein [Paenibacillus aceris]|uniref:Aldouronate transport system substrate-binding protein n=1 Tax=Paenibacillus aceris TaxID=869555 RepID=A0ABS4I1X0_9BACL|nr:extracellular solute-binding protein [Paenibacillus aceris]MBP1964912.1 putative aldouronate transport system substrate-binding protein [Paenibacillus aceris]NHW38158.1 extracellular solute-binding protein [Paenibacillus aceris]